MNEKTILIRARVISKQEKTLTVRLEDGYGTAAVVVHEASALPDPAPAIA